MFVRRVDFAAPLGTTAEQGRLSFEDLTQTDAGQVLVEEGGGGGGKVERGVGAGAGAGAGGGAWSAPFDARLDCRLPLVA